MSYPGDRSSDSSPSREGIQQAPLVIVSESGRHTEESRRIVRAQAARASAAQSRVTRARNRGEREATSRAWVQSPPIRSPTTQHSLESPSGSEYGHDQGLIALPMDPGVQGTFQLPLATWLPTVLGGTAGAVIDPSMMYDAASARPWADRASYGEHSPGDSGKFQLPLALPRGFAALQQRLPMSDTVITLLSRTACIDFASPGVEIRLHQLLFDLIIKGAGTGLSTQPSHPIQSHLRIACTCLTLFQGQRANVAVFAQDQKYQSGLEAAWSEATMLDQTPLGEPKSAEASLWAVFVISVTTGATASFFQLPLRTLLQDLQLGCWEQVRRVLLDFIYPVSFLDEPCEQFYNSICHMQNTNG